jgi:prepilin-type N-terminal cleavage/methylation domain-containing protein
MNSSFSHRRTAFSLLELIAVVIIVGIMATLILPRAVAARDEAAEKACAHNRMLINSAVERFAVTTGSDPADLSVLASDPDYFPEGIPVCPVSGHAYTLNTTTHRVDQHANGVHP